MIKDFLPNICEALNVERYTNASIRPTAIRAMKRCGAEDREVASISGHRNLASLRHYEPGPCTEKLFDLAQAISTSGAKRPRLSATITSEEAQNQSQDQTPNQDQNHNQDRNKNQDQNQNQNVVEETLTVPADEIEVIDFDIDQVEVVVEKSEIVDKDSNKENESALTQENLKTDSVPSSVLSLLKREQDLAAKRNALMEKLLNSGR